MTKKKILVNKQPLVDKKKPLLKQPLVNYISLLKVLKEKEARICLGILKNKHSKSLIEWKIKYAARRKEVFNSRKGSRLKKYDPDNNNNESQLCITFLK